MTALTGPRRTPERTGDTRAVPAAAGHVFHPGAIAALDTATGYAVRAVTATGLRGLGRVDVFADTNGLADGDAHVSARTGIFRFANDSGDPVDRTAIGTSCFIADDQTVAATDGGGTRSPAGIVHDVDAQGVWVKFT
jgi:hypothetical protein